MVNWTWGIMNRVLVVATVLLIGMTCLPRAVIASDWETNQIWEKQIKKLAVLEGHKHPVADLVFGLDGRMLVSVDKDDELIIWEVENSKQIWALPRKGPQPHYLKNVAFSSDDELLGLVVKGRLTGLGFELGPALGRRVRFPMQPGDRVNALGVDSDGQLLASGLMEGGDGESSYRVWNARLRDSVASVEIVNGSTESTDEFSPDGRFLVSRFEIGDETELRLLDIVQGDEVARLRGLWKRRSFVFSPDSRLAAWVERDSHQIWLYDLNAREETVLLDGHKRAVTAIAFSPNGELLASGGADDVMMLWDVKERVHIAKLTRRGQTVLSIAFSPDGRLIASGSTDRFLTLWDAERREEIARIEGHSDQVNTVAFSSDSRLVASGSADKVILVWDLSRLSLPSQAGNLANSGESAGNQTAPSSPAVIQILNAMEVTDITGQAQGSFISRNPQESVLIVHTNIQDMSFSSTNEIINVDSGEGGKHVIRVHPGTHLITFKADGFTVTQARFVLEKRKVKVVRVGVAQ